VSVPAELIKLADLVAKEKKISRSKEYLPACRIGEPAVAGERGRAIEQWRR